MPARTCSGPPRATASPPTRGRPAASSPGPAPAGVAWRSACSCRSGASTRRWPRSASCSARPTCPTPSARWTVLTEGFVLLNANRLDSAESRFERIADLGYVHDNPRLIAAAAWGMAVVAARRSDLPATLRWIATRREHGARRGRRHARRAVPVRRRRHARGARRARRAAALLARATARRPDLPGPGRSTTFLLDARAACSATSTRRSRDAAGGVVAGEAASPRTRWPRRVDLDGAQRLLDDAAPRARRRSVSPTSRRSARAASTASCSRCCELPRRPATAPRGRRSGRARPIAGAAAPAS